MSWINRGQNTLTLDGYATTLPFVNVKDAPFGAKGDGTTDDTTAIVAAIAAVSYGGGNAARAVYFPVGTYVISSTIEVPPNVTLVGVGRFSSSLTGSTIYVTHDGVGIRFVRRNTGADIGTGCWHMGGAVELGFTGLGSSGTSAQHLVDIGDSSVAYDGDIGAWDVVIQRCSFNSTGGYAIYATNAQEVLIDDVRVDNCRFGYLGRDVVAGGRIINSEFLDEAAVAWLDGAIGIELRAGSGGGNIGFLIDGNYFIGFDKQVWVAGVNGVAVVNNTGFEAANRDGVVLSKYQSNEITLESTVGCEGCLIEGNSFLSWSASIAGGAAVRIQYSFSNHVGVNQYQSPNAGNAGTTAAISLFDGGDGTCKNNRIWVPGTPDGAGKWVVSDGAGGASTVRAIDLNTTTVAQNTLYGAEWQQPKSLTADPSTTSWGAGEKGRNWFNSTTNSLKLWNGSAVESLQPAPGQTFVSYTLLIKNNAGTIQHQIVTDTTNQVTTNFATPVTGASATAATTPYVTSGVGFTSGGGIENAAQQLFHFNTAAQTNGNDAAAASIVFNSTGTIVMAELIHRSININGTTRNRLALNFTKTDGTPFTLDTGNIAASKIIAVRIQGYVSA